jgi:hypothetical protein
MLMVASDTAHMYWRFLGSVTPERSYLEVLARDTEEATERLTVLFLLCGLRVFLSVR